MESNAQRLEFLKRIAAALSDAAESIKTLISDDLIPLDDKEVKTALLFKKKTEWFVAKLRDTTPCIKNTAYGDTCNCRSCQHNRELFYWKHGRPL